MTYWLEILPQLLNGLKLSVTIFLLTQVVALPLGLALAVLARGNNPIIKKLISTFTWIMRGTPLLLQLYITMYGIPLLIPMHMDRFFAGAITFIINYAAYYTEIFRNGLAIIPTGQSQAGQVLGFKKLEIFWYITLPQMFRNTLVPLINEAITLVKDTALLAAIALADMLRNAKEIVGQDLKIDALVMAGLLYLGLSYIIVQIGKRLEKKFLLEI